MLEGGGVEGERGRGAVCGEVFGEEGDGGRVGGGGEVEEGVGI